MLAQSESCGANYPRRVSPEGPKKIHQDGAEISKNRGNHHLAVAKAFLIAAFTCICATFLAVDSPRSKNLKRFLYLALFFVR